MIVQGIDGGYRVKRGDGWVVDVMAMAFNWRVVLHQDNDRTYDRGFCYFGRDDESLARALRAAAAWDDPYNTDPEGFDKVAFG
jgi:hypothetical protein